MKNFVLIGLFIILSYSCSDDIFEYDFRNQFLGNYHFTVLKYYYSTYPTETGTTTFYDTIAYEYDGVIEEYRDNRILIKYSQIEPIGRCVSFYENGWSWCQGLIDSDCISYCDTSQLFYVENWITPILKDNDSLILFENYSLKNGKGCFFKRDSMNFELVEHEKMYGSEEYITGNKID